ncbi:MAG: M3 family metallopeptidase [Myxococcota bacterium]
MVDAPTWDLETLCPGGPGGAEFARRRDGLRARLVAVRDRLASIGPIAGDPAGWSAVILEIDALHDAFGEIASLALCAASTDSRSTVARAGEAESDELRLLLDEVMVGVGAALDAIDDAPFAGWTARPELVPLDPYLRHLRSGRALRLEASLQALKVAMDREAITAWGRLYDQLSGDLTAELTVGGQTRRLGIAELAAMRAEPDPAAREAAFRAGQGAWATVRGTCAHTLTQITGARQQHNDRLGVDELAETCHRNRIDRATLDAMWAAADAARPALVRYLDHKAKRLGKPRLDWWDVDAPLNLSSSTGAPLSFAAAAAEVADAFDGFHPELGRFARDAVDHRWIDAFPRDGRRSGGYCTGFPLARQSRIFMTFTGTIDNAVVLAHELGHAYHNHVLDGVPSSRANLTSALAETASTFGEAVFRDHLLARATDPALRTFVLDQQLQAAVAFLMDIPHRFAVERELYAVRRGGVFDPDDLSARTVAAQRRWYGDALGSWNPLFWCSKLHYYIPEFGFYNWPYAFGYLFSAAVHARAKAAGPSFLGPFRELLLRTGWQDSDVLAQEVLGADLRDPAFWVEAVRPIATWVDQLVEVTA